MGLHTKALSSAVDDVPVAPAWSRNGIWWIVAALCAGLLGVIYYDALALMVGIWVDDENYGHGFFVPFISLFLIWMKRDKLRALEPRGSWWGLSLVLVGLALYVMGELGTLAPLLQLSFWLVLVGLCWATLGGQIVRALSFPLLYLLTMIPLPQFLLQGLSGQLQLLSSALGVGCLQVVGITAFREGNVIDLGPIQLQVVEACSGLRYLFPLMSLALLCAYLFQGPMWKRAVVFLSSMPIAIVLNGFRIGVIGVLVEYFGAGAADGFLHLFEGWVIFLISLAILALVMWGLARIGSGNKRQSFSDLLRLPSDSETVVQPGAVRSSSLTEASPAPFFCSVGLLVCLAVASPYLISRDEIVPERQALLNFPMQVQQWQGSTFPLEKEYIETLRFDDYLLADYHVADGAPVNFYVAYYGSQRKGQSAHSPRTCIPGGGWEITSLRTMEVPANDAATTVLQVNRLVIQKAGAKQIVYYWFKQRDRVLANEYLVKFFLFWDALAKQRTDGALIRLTASVQPGHEENEADRVLADFTKSVNPLMSQYVPD
ncbi:MAG: VPLPA-CTERM-specific exosortase XrtD [Nitrospira sp.]|nr:MAG: VPLPA-CTERM-specific exosortase XrtD [Nitrospira sp.]